MTVGRVADPVSPFVAPRLTVVSPELPDVDGPPLDGFQECGHYLIAWIALALRRGGEYRAVSADEKQAMQDRLSLFPSQEGEPVPTILADIDELMQQGVLQWNHPRHFGDPSSSASGPAILGEMLGAALGCSGSAWKSSPAAVAMTKSVQTWLRQMIGLPLREAFACDGRSHGNLVALTAAVGWCLETEAQAAGQGDASRFCIYTSEFADPNLEGIASAVGLPVDSIRRLPVDDMCRLRGEILSNAMEADRNRGFIPCLVVGSLVPPPDGSTDVLWELAAACARPRVWFHVDASTGGGGAIAPEVRPILLGGERSDSLLISPNRWLGLPGDSAVLYSRRPAYIKQALSARRDLSHIKFKDSSPVESFNPLSMWFALRCFGWDGLVRRIQEHLRLARLVASWIDAHPAFERLAPVPLSTVCFRARPPGIPADAVDAVNQALEQHLASEGEVRLLSGTLSGVRALGFVINGARTDEIQVRRAWALVRNALRLVVEQWLQGTSTVQGRAVGQMDNAV
jgi:aromatic-L-amino-acid decarboxylase